MSRSYHAAPRKDNPPTEIRNCPKCGHTMTPQWDSAPQYKGRWRYRCNPCRSKDKKSKGKRNGAEEYRRLIERNPNYTKEKRARAKERNPNLYKERYRRAKERGARERDSDLMQAYRLKSRLAKFGLTPEQYLLMLEQQGHVCAICKRSEPLKTISGKMKMLAVDHDHTTGEVRALLCSQCNRALGLAGEDAERLRAMADYIEFHCSK